VNNVFRPLPKLLFGDERNKSLLASLLSSFMELPDEYEIAFLDTSLKPETEDDKLGIVDIKLKIGDREIINLEIQVHPVKNIGRRLSFYKSKLIVEQIGKSEMYNVIQKVVCVCITDYELFPGNRDYLNRFRFFNPKNGQCFEDIPEEVYTLELPKVPSLADGTKGWEWMRFLKAKRKEEFEMIAGQNPEIRKAVNTLYEISADDKVRAEYEMRQKAWRDRMSQFHGYFQDGRLEGLQEGVQKGRLEGLQEGVQKGRLEGLHEGVQKGRLEEQRRILEFLKSGRSPEEIMREYGGVM
jgi:predicted transposase/invertase (TIGR01784 family)